jgi:hypothetical protein
LVNASLKKSFLQKPFENIFENPLMQEFYENVFLKKNPHCGGRSILRIAFKNPFVLKRKPCSNRNKDTT